MSVQAIDTPFIPTAPARLDKPASVLNQLFGGASRNLVQWWTADSFRTPVTTNTVLGTTYQEWLARFEFAPVPGHHVEVTSDIALRPKGGLPLIVSRRAA